MSDEKLKPEPTSIEHWLDWLVEYNHLMPWREVNLRYSAKLAIERYADRHVEADIARLMNERDEANTDKREAEIRLAHERDEVTRCEKEILSLQRELETAERDLGEAIRQRNIWEHRFLAGMREREDALRRAESAGGKP